MNTPKKSVQAVAPVSTLRVPLWQKVMRWIGWGVLYVVVFYLGNVSGEYVAAHLPILPSMPSISKHIETIRNSVSYVHLPKLSFSWNWPQKDSKTPVESAARTKLVIVRGNFINMPLAGATQQEREEFSDAIKKLSVRSATVRVQADCQIDPAFVRVTPGRALTFTNATALDRQIVVGQDISLTLEKYNNVSTVLSESSGTYPILCDGQIVGFSQVE